MIYNILTIALRNLRRHFTYSLINIVGLSIGIACSLVMMLYVHGEWSYDRGFANADRIYRVGVSFFNIGRFANGPERLLDVLPAQYAGLETATRIRRENDVLLKVDSRQFEERLVYYTDSAFFKVFTFEFIAGSSAKVLQEPHEVVITQSMASKFFGHEDVLGKVILVGKEEVPFHVTGVVKDNSFNTHVNAKIWISNHDQLTGEKAWSSAAFHSYLLLRKGQTEADLAAAIDRMIEETVFPEFGKNMGIQSMEDYRKNDNAVKFYVHPLKDIYLKSKFAAELSPGGNESNIYTFLAIALFILTLAVVNFINLTTARATHRAKEIGIRKTMGTTRSRLMGQFLLESCMTSSLAMVVAFVLAEMFLRMFEYVTGLVLLPGTWMGVNSLFIFLSLSVIIGLLAGIYPAIYLTRFEPVKVLKGNYVGGSNAAFRNTLVVFQFTVSITLIICAVIAREQMDFMRTRALGFEQDNIVTIDNLHELGTSAEAFKTELDKHNAVVASSFHTGEPGSRRIFSFYTYQTAVMESPLTITTYQIDTAYMSLMGIRLLDGRTFEHGRASDSLAVILNESAVAALDLGANAVGSVINNKQTVIGVVSDFHWESLRSAIAPLAFVQGSNYYEVSFKLRAGGLSDFMKMAESQWKALAPGERLDSHFVDSNFGDILMKEQQVSRAIDLFTALAVMISCLGLFGLSAYTAEQRTKEIGIRKVLGATVSNIVLMLNRRFTILVAISLLLATPLGFFISSIWLGEFAYRVEQGAGVYFASGLLALSLAWITVGYHSFRASALNPADTLKYE
jgi:putative ABC transport system permease protein